MYITVSTKIGASPQKIWAILTDLKHITNWNPLIREVDGELKSGKRLSMTLRLTNSLKLRYRPYVLKVEPFNEVRCLSSLVFPGILDSEYVLILQKLDEEKTLITQAEKFKGLMLPIFWNEIESKLKNGLMEMNKALKYVAEKENCIHSEQLKSN